MKTSAILIGAAATLVAAQFPANFPACGGTCITNMLGLASSFGCTADNAQCLCSNVNFVYGVRDCADQACPGGASGTDASAVKSFGVNYCYAAGIAVSGIPASIVATNSPTTTIFATNSPGPATSGLATVSASASNALSSIGSAATSVGSAIGSGASSIGSAVSSAISTIPIISTITSGGSVITSTIGQSTIFGIGGAIGSAISTIPIVTTISSGGSVITSTIGQSTIFASGSATTIVSGSQTVITSGSTTFTTTVPVTSTSTTAPTTSSSRAFAAQRTAAPVGFLAAAGFAAMLL